MRRAYGLIRGRGPSRAGRPTILTNQRCRRRTSVKIRCAPLYYAPSTSSPPAKISPGPLLPPRAPPQEGASAASSLTTCFGSCSLPFSAAQRRVEAFLRPFGCGLLPCGARLSACRRLSSRRSSNCRETPGRSPAAGCGWIKTIRESGDEAPAGTVFVGPGEFAPCRRSAPVLYRSLTGR